MMVWKLSETIPGEFNSQEVANTMWVFATMGRKPGERTMGYLERWKSPLFE
jgi:hypothetical protein